MFNSKHHILKAVLGSAMAGLLLFGISSKASAAKVDKNYAVKTTTSLTERAKVVSVKDRSNHQQIARWMQATAV